MKSYKFRLYPNKHQEINLLKTFYLCRFTYNKLLEELNKQEKIDRGVIQHKIVELRKSFPELKEVYAKILYYECYRLFSNLKGLSESKKKGNKVGRLRFKSSNRFKTIHYNQYGYKITKRKDKRYDKLHLSKIGEIDIYCHRKYSGNIKQVTIEKKVDSWYAIIITDEEYTLEKGNKQLGLDMGVINFFTDSDGNKSDNPLFMNKSLDRLKKVQRKLSKSKLRSNNRRKIIDRLLKVHEKIDNQKQDFFHKETTKLVNNCSMIAVEDLNISEMTNTSKNKYHNMRNILDSSWGIFTSMLKLKAESAGVSLIKVDPRNTTKMCNVCGNIQDMPIWNRIYKCNNCGLILDRDHNAALNILALGRGFVESSNRDLRKQEVAS